MVKQFKSLQFECEVALNWFNENKMIVNLRKFQAIIIDKRKQDHTKETFKIGSKEIKVTSQLKLFGVEIDNKLNLEQHINRICKSAANQLDILIKLKRFLGFQERKALLNSFVLSNFNYSLLYGCLQALSPLLKLKTYIKEQIDSCLSIIQLPTK